MKKRLITLLVAIALQPICDRTMAQVTPVDFPTPDLSQDEALLMFVVPLPETSGQYEVCLDDTVIGSLSKLSFMTTVTTAGRHMLWCDIASQWLDLKPGRKYAFVLGQGLPTWVGVMAAATATEVTVSKSDSSGAGRGRIWYLDDFDTAARMVLQLGMDRHEAVPEEAPAEWYEKTLDRMQEVEPEPLLPAEFSKVVYRNQDEFPPQALEKRFLRKAKGWRSSGRPAGKLRISAQSVQFESRERRVKIPVSLIETVAFAKLVGDVPWLSIQYRLGAQMRTAYLAREYGGFNRIFLALVEAAEGESPPTVD